MTQIALTITILFGVFFFGYFVGRKQILDEMKNNLLELNHLVSSNTYSIYQEDYYGISVEIFENGTTSQVKAVFENGTTRKVFFKGVV